MTHDEIDALPPGPDMDVLVAVEVLGWTPSVKSLFLVGKGGGAIDVHGWFDGHEWRQHPAPLSTEIGAAWEVIRGLQERELPIEIHWMSPNGWYVRVGGDVLSDQGGVVANEGGGIPGEGYIGLPTIICRAALKTVSA